jgi:hypothetical protein
MWIFSKNSPAHARCRPTRLVETRLADSIGLKALLGGKDTTGPIQVLKIAPERVNRSEWSISAIDAGRSRDRVAAASQRITIDSADNLFMTEGIEMCNRVISKIESMTHAAEFGVSKMHQPLTVAHSC